MNAFLNFLLFAVHLVFGVFVSASILDIKLNKKNVFILFTICILLYFSQIICFLYLGEIILLRIYPIITHLPLILIFNLFYKRPLTLSVTSVSIAYFCCEIDEWIGILLEFLTSSTLIFSISRIVCCIIVGVVFIKYVSKYTSKLFLRSKLSPITFGIIPILYYFFDYITTIYTDLLYSGNTLATEFMPFVCCVGYLVFIIFYFKEYELKCDAERHKQLLNLQYQHTANQIQSMRRSEYEMQIIRHDMRHMLTNLSTLIDNNDIEKSKEYLHQIINIASCIKLQRYCENELINAVLSYYNHKCNESNIILELDVQIPEVLSCNEMDFSSILSNSLENACNAVPSKNKTDSTISVKIVSDEMNHLLLCVRNPFEKEPIFEDNLPVTYTDGHGFGTKSIKYLTEKTGGKCHFIVKDNLFTLQVII